MAKSQAAESQATNSQMADGGLWVESARGR